MRLQELHFKPLYIVPRDNYVREALIQPLKRVHMYDCMFGFFHSAGLADIAPGLASYLNREDTAPIRLIASPNISKQDASALREGVTIPSQVLEVRMRKLLGQAKVDSSALVRHTLTCLAYLLSVDRLKFRLAWMVNGSLFHPKVWIFKEGGDCLVVHGSSNLTSSGLSTNHEQIRVDASWDGIKAQESIHTLVDEFEAIWAGSRDYVKSLDLPLALEHDLVREYGSDQPPTEEDFHSAWKEDGRLISDLIDPENSSPRLVVPPHLVLDSGPFAHQGKAVEAWEQNRRRGILTMATGSGKTITALVAATRLQAEVSSLLVVISAPYRPLVAQWVEETRDFGVTPLPLEGTTAVRAQRLDIAVDRLRAGECSVVVQVATIDFLTSDPFQQVLDSIPSSIKILFIADEMHNLGQPRFLSITPERFDYRLGLSATPERQYDTQGTEELFDYFGPSVFEFSLREAIGVCLVPYDYHIHTTSLTDREYEEWLRLTDRLRRIGFGPDHDAEPSEAGPMPEAVKRLLIRRRRVIESAENKVDVLRSLLQHRSRNDIRHTLVYATDKNQDQLKAVNHMLQHDLNLIIHEFTAKESASRAKSANLLGQFAAGEYHILTCMRVLDEGLDVPQVNEAFLLASNTVRRQWIQRRGRVLRKCDAIGKTMANLHDFVVVPPDLQDADARSILYRELDRAMEFAELAQNGPADGGPFDAIRSLQELTTR